MSESLEQRLARIGDEAEAGELDQTPRPIPPGVKVSQPNKQTKARGKVLQIRFTDNELELLDAIAGRRGLPVSVYARDVLLSTIDRELAPEGVESLVSSLVAIASQLQDSIVVADGVKARVREPAEGFDVNISGPAVDAHH